MGMLRYVFLRGYVAEKPDQASETINLSLSELIHAIVIAIVHEVVDGWEGESAS